MTNKTPAYLEKRKNYIPTLATKIQDKQSSAVVYLYMIDGKPAARGFYGRKFKPDFGFYYNSAAEREKDIAQFFERTRKQEKNLNKPHNLEIGHVFVSSWGYDQTNVDFYQVVALRGKTTVVLRKISKVKHSDNCMYGTCIPVIDEFDGEEFSCRVKEKSVKIGSSQYAYLWDGKPQNWTAYA